MPIVKERLLALINAAERIELVYNTTCQSVLNALRDAKSSSASADEIIETIAQLVGAYQVHIVEESRAIFVERTWYNAHRRRAEREKEYHEQKRRAQGVKPLGFTPRPQQPAISPKMQFINEMKEKFDLEPEFALKVYEEQIEGEPPKAPLTPGALPSAYEPSPEDDQDYALPQAEGDEDSDKPV